MSILLSEAIQEIRKELLKSALENDCEDVIFTPTQIELELGITFKIEAKASAKAKLLTLLDISSEAKLGKESQHKIKLSMSVCDRNGDPLKINSTKIPRMS